MTEFVSIPRSEYEGLKETISILQNQDLVRMIRESQKNIVEGKTQTLDEVMEELDG